MDYYQPFARRRQCLHDRLKLLSGQERSFLRLAFTSRFVSVFAVAALFLVGCGTPRDARYAPKELKLSGSVLPREIIADSKETSGIYPLSATDESGAMCCWMAIHARALVAHPSHSRKLIAYVYIPEVKPFQEHAQSLAISLPKVREYKSFAALGPGFHRLVVNTPRLFAVSAPQIVTFDASVRFVPLGVKGPRYGVLLVSVYFE